MRVLLVNPATPESYWSGSRALPFARRRSLLPPLGLITVAAMLPAGWPCRLMDLNIERLRDRDLIWADLVMLSGMTVQSPSLKEVLRRCRRLGVRTVVGGPHATSSPEDVNLADYLVLGEGEELVPRLASDLAAGCARPVYRETRKPDLDLTPVPRYDLLKIRAYHQMSVQFSRGCPYSCEFCDVIVLYGRRPRTRSAEHVIVDLDAIRATGFSGDVFFVDDNFIGNKKAVRQVLPLLAAWRRRSRVPFEFYTEASINLAEDPELMRMMTDAGFTAVFVGIETPSLAGLQETGKLQNLRCNLTDQVHALLAHGLDVWGGFILGFDSDGPDIFQSMVRFIKKASIPYAMIGMLSAPPNTPLHRRLWQEGRLRTVFSGDQFGLTNVITRLPMHEMLAGYRHVLQTLYEPEAFFQRCRENLSRWQPSAGSMRRLALRDLLSAWRAIRGQGFTGTYRRAYWRFLRWVIGHHPRKLKRAISQAAAGHHYILYTREIVLPALISATGVPDQRK